LVTWLSAGQSIYRLLLPCLTLMVLIGGINFGLQELVLPAANQRQDDLRNLIRSRGVPRNTSGKFWSANGQRIYSFEPGQDTPPKSSEGPDTINNASDNESDILPTPCLKPSVARLTVYEFSENAGLQAVFRTPCAVWRQGSVHIDRGTRTSFQNGSQQTSDVRDLDIADESNPFLALRSKPSHLTVDEAAIQRDASESDVERQTFGVAVERKYLTALLPLVIALFTAPFALSTGRQGKAATVGLAVALWLIFMAVTSMFEQFGLSGSLEPRIAVWGPAALFALIGVLLLSRAKT
jgi:lipopolysaccharide export LptBFGC system permease protein LptF